MMYREDYLFAFLTASKLLQEVNELKGNVQHFKTDPLRLSWVDSYAKEAYWDKPLYLQVKKKVKHKCYYTNHHTHKKTPTKTKTKQILKL